MKRLTGIVLTALALAGCGRVAGIPSSMIGDTLAGAQLFELKTPEGSVLSLPQTLAQKKVVLIDFWATWCTYCVEEMPDLIKLQEKYGAQGFQLIGVNAGESAEQVAPFVKKMGLNYPIALDEDMAVSQAYRLVGIPTSFLVAPDGKVLGQYSGFSPKVVSDIEKYLG